MIMRDRTTRLWPPLKIWAIVLCVGLLTSCSSQNSAVDLVTVVPVVKATRGELSNELVLTAEFIPYQDVDVMAKVAGYLKTIRVDMGDHVRAGDLLATLEDPEMENELAKSDSFDQGRRGGREDGSKRPTSRQVSP